MHFAVVVPFPPLHVLFVVMLIEGRCSGEKERCLDIKVSNPPTPLPPAM